MASRSRLDRKKGRGERDEEDVSRRTPSVSRDESGPVRSLQRAVGNQAVKAMAESGAIAPRNGAGRSRSAGPTDGRRPSVSNADEAVIQRQSDSQERSGTDDSGEQKGEPWANKSELEKHKKAGEKAFNAFRQTDLGKQLENRALGELEKSMWKPVWESTSGKVAVITLSPMGAVLLDGPLPFSAPEFRLDEALGMDTDHKIWAQANLVGLPQGKPPYAADKVKTNLAWSAPDSPVRLGVGAELTPGKLHAEDGPRAGPGGQQMNWQVMLNLRIEDTGWW